MKTIQLTEDDVLPESEAEELKGIKPDDENYDRLIDDRSEDVKLLKPNGDVLAVVVRGAIPEDACHEAYKNLRPVAIAGGKDDGNRGVATGKDSKEFRTLDDGSKSDMHYVPKEMSPNTGIAGNFDRYSRFPYCRQTAFKANNPEKFEKAIPMFQHAADAMEKRVPERYANQQEKAKKTVDDWMITKTPFTTATVNLNWQTAVHKDSGDLKEGFGVMTVIRFGDYEGAYYIQPQYQTAYDLYTGDVILSDVHEWHGNGPFFESDGYFERLSCVLYYREDMDQCGTPKEETERAKIKTDPTMSSEEKDAALEMGRPMHDAQAARSENAESGSD